MDVTPGFIDGKRGEKIPTKEVTFDEDERIERALLIAYLTNPFNNIVYVEECFPERVVLLGSPPKRRIHGFIDQARKQFMNSEPMQQASPELKTQDVQGPYL